MDIPWNPVETCKKKVWKHESNYWYYAVEIEEAIAAMEVWFALMWSEQGHVEENT